MSTDKFDMKYETPFSSMTKPMVACINDWKGTENFSVTSQKKADILHYLLRNKEEMETLLAFDPITQKEFFDAFLISIAKKSQHYNFELLAKRLSDWTCDEANDAYKARILRYLCQNYYQSQIDTILSLDPISQKAFYDAYLLEIGRTMPSGY
jgi:hypothetical protein